MVMLVSLCAETIKPVFEGDKSYVRLYKTRKFTIPRPYKTRKIFFLTAGRPFYQVYRIISTI